MSGYTITYTDTGVAAYLDQLAARMADLTPVMQDLGEYLVMSTKARFATSTAPDGTPWASNSQVTIGRYLGNYSGMYKKSGALSKKGATRSAAKKPLIGESRRLSGEIHAVPTAHGVTVGSVLIYSAVQQFGAAKGSLGPRTPWGNIPARPYLGLSASDRGQVIDLVQGYLAPA
ncbi:Phage virion morphogenesis protein [Thiomonas sp. CB3]|nr:Phage virion morphogenesis protein [Thiomonas sp. CB3]